MFKTIILYSVGVYYDDLTILYSNIITLHSRFIRSTMRYVFKSQLIYYRKSI